MAKIEFPNVFKTKYQEKNRKLLGQYERFRKTKDDKYNEEFSNLFDVTKEEGLWLSSEDKMLYLKQVESKGRIGYTTVKAAPMSSIHPSKRRKLAQKSSEQKLATDSSSETETVKTSSSDEFIPHTNKKEYAKTDKAADLVHDFSLSTRQAYRVTSRLTYEYGVPNPSQTGIWRRVLKDGENKIVEMKDIINKEKSFCLHFDGERISNTEYQVVCLSSSNVSMHLGVLKCSSGSVEDIFNPLKDLIDEFNLWDYIKMIVSDTTAVNTGKTKGERYR